MDTLKASATNVHTLTDIDATDVRLYACEKPASFNIPHVSSQIAELREKGIICTGNDDHIWLFQLDEAAAAENIPLWVVLKANGTIAEPGQMAGIDGQSIVNTFVQALEESVSFALLRAHGALKLSSWTWLLPETVQNTPGVRINMHHRLSEDGKKLNVVTSIQEWGLVRLTRKHHHDACRVFLAPGGVSATLAPGGHIGSRASKVPAELRNDQWKALVRRSLLVDGIQLPEDVSWMSIVPLDAAQGALWPEPLCFSSPGYTGINHTKLLHNDNWRSWFQNTDSEPHGDPLSFAEEWTIGFAEREQTKTMIDAPVAEDSAMDDVPGVQPLANATAFDVTSPPLTNRPDLQAFHGIYPTPPDGLATHTGPQAQTHSDNISAPTADTTTQPAFTPSDPLNESNTAVIDGMSVAEGDHAPRNHSIVSSVGLQGNDWNRGSSDDLFGDMDDLEYGREEVGDADFNFFDEPDDVPLKAGMIIQPPADSNNNEIQQDTENIREQQPEEPHFSEPLSRNGNDQHASHEQTLQPTNTGNTTEPPLPSEPTPDKRAVGDGKIPVLSDVEIPTELRSAEDKKFDHTKPLSPFGIREALLPPPIPASASQTHPETEKERRRSSFGPLVFNTSGSLTFKSSSYDYSDYKPDECRTSYELAPTRLPIAESRRSPASTSSTSSIADHHLEDGDQSDSDADSLSTTSYSSPVAEVSLEEGSSMATRKRKRTLDTSAYCGPQSASTGPGSRVGRMDQAGTANAGSEQRGLLLTLLGKSERNNRHHGQTDWTNASFAKSSSFMDHTAAHVSPTDNPRSTISETCLLPEQEAALDKPQTDLRAVFPELKPDDLIIISQVVSEQAASAMKNIVMDLDALGCGSMVTTNEEHRVLSELGESFKAGIPSFSTCDIPSLTLVRESLPVQRPQPNPAMATPAAQARHPLRPQPRIDPTTMGPDILPLPASYIRAQRGDAAWEMVPTALGFWEALGLGPVSGSKDIRHFCVAPDGDMLSCQLLDFLQNLKATYECCKFGSMALGAELIDKPAAHNIDIQTITSVAFDSSAELPIVGVAQAYWNVCTALGVQLASLAFDDPGRTFVISMINPFHYTDRQDWILANQCFAACFLQVSKSYRAAAARIGKRDGKIASQTTMSDIDFKVLPISLVASSSSLVVPTAQQMGSVAREYYDRCPPLSDAVEDPCPMSNAAAPSVELVAPLPKRISFQLASDPPTDLLHEASVLHVAYALSADGDWANVAWNDNTGRYASSSAFCLQGRSFADVAFEVWERTTQLIKAREVIWRVFIATTGSSGVEASRANCWRDIIAQHTDRKQLLSVTLLHFQPSLDLRIMPPLDSATQLGQGTGSGAPTPVATPLPVNGQIVSTASPDTVGASNAASTAPPTPAPSEAASTILEADPDAHLIETEDETWGMLIDRHLASIIRPTQALSSTDVTQKQDHIEALSHGVLIKRGKNTVSPDKAGRNETPFPCAGASLIWTLRVRPKNDRQGGGGGGGGGGAGERLNVDEGSARHAEVMLREVMGFFRNLGLLSKIKGLDPSGLVPVHIATAAQGAEGLDGLLGRRTQVKVEAG